MKNQFQIPYQTNHSDIDNFSSQKIIINQPQKAKAKENASFSLISEELSNDFISHSEPFDIGYTGVYYPDKNDFFLAVPITLDFYGLLEKARNEGIHDYKVAKLLSLINMQTIIKSKKSNGLQEYYSKRFTDIHSKITKEILKDDFKKVYYFLKKEEVLVRINYIIYKKSYSYGYNLKHRFRRFKIVKFINNKLTQKITPTFKNYRTKKSCQTLIKVFKRESFGIDYNLAETKLFEKYCSGLNQDISGGFMLNDIYNSMLKYGSYHQGVVQLLRFLNGEYYFNRLGGTKLDVEISAIKSERRRKIMRLKKNKDEQTKILEDLKEDLNKSGLLENEPSQKLTNTFQKIKDIDVEINEIKKTREPKEPKIIPIGRFYSSFSSLNNEVRKLLHFDNEKLIQIDIKNCVSFLLANYINLGGFHFSQGMFSYITSSNSYKSYCYKLFEKTFQDWRIILEVDNYHDILKPISELEFIFEDLRGNKIPNIDVKSFLFQKDCPKNTDDFCKQLPKENILKSSKEIKTVNTTETIVRFPEFSCLKNEIRFNKLKIKVKPKVNESNRLVNLKNNKLETGETKKTNETMNKSLAYVFLSINMFPEFFENSFQKEIKRFLELAKQGDFYEFFISDFKSKYDLETFKKLYMERTNEDYNESAKHDRTLTKKMITAMIYAPNASAESVWLDEDNKELVHANYYKVKEVFVKHFPILYSLIHELKKEGNKLLSTELFNLEAEIMIDTIAKPLIKSRTPCFTVHDCIAVKKSDVNDALKAINNGFIKKLGITPKLDFDDE